MFLYKHNGQKVETGKHENELTQALEINDPKF